MQSDVVRWGVLSTARIADAVIRGMRMANNCELVASASRELDRAQAWAAERDVPEAFGSYDELLQSDKVDAIYIPLPNSMHKEWAIKAAQAGKHVLCEKPLATNAADAEEMFQAAAANNVKLMEAFMYRFHPQVAALRQLVTSGTIGDPKITRATFGFLLTRPNDVRWSKELGGGALLDVGCYCASLSRYVAMEDPAAVTASAAWADTGVDATVTGTLEFPGGLLGTIDCSFQTGPDGHEWFSVSGVNGHLGVPNPFKPGEEQAVIWVEKGEASDRRSSFYAAGAYHYHLMVQSFVDAVLNDRPVEISPKETIGNMRTLDALLESARTGRRVELAG